MDQTLEDTKITGKQIQKWLSDYFEHPVHVKSCKAKKIAAGEGFTSTILRVSLEYENGQEDSLPKTVIVKTPSMAALEDLMQKMMLGQQQGGKPPGQEGDASGHPPPAGQGQQGGPPQGNIDEMIEFSTFGHSLECEAYRIFGKNPPIPLPKIYAATKCHAGEMGAIVMEDLGEKSAIIGDPTCALTLDQLYEAAEAVGSWHAWCLTTDVDWKSHVEPADSARRTQTFTGWFDMMKAVFERVKVNYPGVFDKLDQMMAARPLNIDEFSQLLTKHRAMAPDTIVHGDFYANNLMYEITKDPSGKTTVGSKLVSIIDWPMAHSGSCMEDFSRLLSTSVDTETRRRHTNDILKRYYDTLVKKAGRDKVKFSLEDVVTMYEDNLIMAGMFFVLMLDWLQNLFVRETGEEGERKRKILFDRCLGVYEDIMPLMEKQAAEAART